VGQPKNLIVCTVVDQVQIKASVEQSYAVEHKLDPTGPKTFTNQIKIRHLGASHAPFRAKQNTWPRLGKVHKINLNKQKGQS
jgi:hypothetical protein